MSQTARSVLAALLTYVLVHAGERVFGFSPTRAWPTALGWAVDFGLWALVYVGVYAALRSAAARRRS